jgi:hypothetical protein
MYLITGICASGRIIVGVNYMNEFIPEKYQNMTTTLIFAFDAFTMIY